MDAHTTNALESKQIAEAKAATLRNAALGVLGVRGRYIPSEPRTASQHGCGVVHLYRDVEQSSDLKAEPAISISGHDAASEDAYVDNERTTLCVLAVPSHMTPSDLLGWFGSDTLELVSHFRLVKTSRSDRYMVLLKFKDSQAAMSWQKQWNGKLFNSTEVCFIDKRML